MIKLTRVRRKDHQIQSIILNENYIVKIIGEFFQSSYALDRNIEGSMIYFTSMQNESWSELVRETPDQILELINNQTLALKLQQELYGET